MLPHSYPAHDPQPSSASLHSRNQSSQAGISLSNVPVQPFAAFRAQTNANSSSSSSSPVRRKPLPANTSPVTQSGSVDLASSHPTLSQDVEQRPSRSASVDNPPPLGPPRLGTVQAPSSTNEGEDLVREDLDGHGPNGQLNINPSRTTPLEHYRKLSRTSSESGIIYKPFVPPQLRHDRSDSDAHKRQQPSISEADEDLRSTFTGLTHTRTHTSSSTYSIPSDLVPRLSLKIDGVSGETVEEELSAQTLKPKSPGTKLSSFFGWKPRQPSVTDSPSTTFSGQSSPALSPMFSRRAATEAARQAPSALDTLKANSLTTQNTFFNVPGTPLVSNSPGINAHVEELERELQHISTELAESIRREMELEDELDRIRAEVPASIAPSENRRTSDYYSDSGASSVRYPFSDNDTKLDELEKQRRKAEQERAQIKVDMAARLQEELRIRRDLEAQVITLEEQLQTDDTAKPKGGDRTRELEIMVEDLRRRLTEERQMKENFEDLLAALKVDLERYRNERDNLHDEVVPQLRARVEGLEGQAAEVERLTYENARMQQELQALKNDSSTLLNARRLSNGFNPIAEEGGQGGGAQRGLTRSNSMARSPMLPQGRGRVGSISRSNSVKNRAETKESLAEQLRDVEEQRDALHKALRNLLDRQEIQAKEHTKRIKALETELQNALTASPKRKAFHEEVKSLREEINHLRRRADDALEQKYQCEKGLSGLRMDLDRAEQETASLRELLKEHERKQSGGENRINVNSSPTLEKSYLALQTTHALSLASIQQMEKGESLEAAGSEVERTMQLLKKSISDAEAERDAAIKEAETYRQQARALQKSEMGHLAKEQSLAADLYASAKRMDSLSAKVQQQLSSNRGLRERLAEAIARGEDEQRASAAKIVELERRLKLEEDKLMLAQQQSEEAVSRHEEDVRELRTHTNAQLQRVRSGVFASASGGGQSGRATPMPGQSPLFLRSPRLDQTTSGPGMSMSEATKTESLEKKVMDLEKALSDADKEMEEVVGRMNMAQMEVAELQSERDEAMRQTRKLKAEIEAERAKVKALMAGSN